MPKALEGGMHNSDTEVGKSTRNYSKSFLCFAKFGSKSADAAAPETCHNIPISHEIAYYVNMSDTPVEVVNSGGASQIVRKTEYKEYSYFNFYKLDSRDKTVNGFEPMARGNFVIVKRLPRSGYVAQISHLDNTLDDDIRELREAMEGKDGARYNDLLRNYELCLVTTVNVDDMYVSDTGICLPTQGLTVNVYNEHTFRAFNKSGRFDACAVGYSDFHTGLDVVYCANSENNREYYWNSPAGPVKIRGARDGTAENYITIYSNANGIRRVIGRAGIEEALSKGVGVRGFNGTGETVRIPIFSDIAAADQSFNRAQNLQNDMNTAKAKHSDLAKALELTTKRLEAANRKQEMSDRKLEVMERENRKCRQDADKIAERERKLKLFGSIAGALGSLYKIIDFLYNVSKPKKKPVPKPQAPVYGFLRGLINYYRMA